jgi:2-polyprenyl-3-methyl-5-hydroxy-6-metoxy-1,4-benzoquinol methylase
MYNKLLNDKERTFYEKALKEIFSYCPDTIKNKVPEANVQQAFVLDTVKTFSNTHSKILCVGAYEDTASETLRKLNYNITEIDPLDSVWKPTNHAHIIKTTLNDFYNKDQKEKYDIIFSTSVIEHVENDELFVHQICDLLNDNGYGILTCDYNNSYKEYMKKPSVDYRLYTKNDFLNRFSNILKNNNCYILEPYDWSGEPDFNNGEAVYSFATFVFKKEKM